MNVNKSILLFTIAICVNVFAIAQSLKHPVIWVTQEEKVQIIENIETYDWAQSIVEQLHAHVDVPLKVHQNDPSAIFKMIPPLAKNDHENREQQAGPLALKHNKVLSLASNAGMLYYLTEDEQYASFAADILAFYIEEIWQRTPESTTICGYAFFDARTTYSVFAIAYDFVYNYINKPGTTVYNRISGKREAFDNVKAQKALSNMVGNVLQEYGKPDKHGNIVSNHPILTAPGALYGILCIEDDVERERLFKVFWESGTAHQNSFKHTILPMFSSQGIWPESLSYSFMPIITMILNMVDRIYPEKDITNEYKHIFYGNFLFDNLRMPDRRFVRYGDSKRNNDQTETLYRYTLSIAKRRGYTDLQQKAELALSQSYLTQGGYRPSINPGQIFNNSEPLELFWGEAIPEIYKGHFNFNKPTVIIEHAGIALQRNAVQDDNEIYGLCGIIGGAHYVHSHLTGIAMELYGAGYVMAPNAGLPPTVKERKIPLHEHYFRLYAGNNTVVVNGSSHGQDEGSWKGNACVWQNTTQNIAAEPKHLEEPICSSFNFATQALKDEVNNCDQQRTLSTIRTSETTAYYLDVFRSKSLNENKFHDYVYHNLGDETHIYDTKDRPLNLKQTDRYQNDIGDVVQSPGWRYFENTRVTAPSGEAVKLRFDLKEDDRYMHLFIPAGVKREYALAQAPPSREARNSYINKKTQVLAVRQNGEAWKRPFTVVLEPGLQAEASVQSVEPLVDGDKVVGAIVVSQVKDKLITDYIICQDEADSTYENKKLKLKFDGRFAIVRTQTNTQSLKISLYIGEGSHLKFGENEISADDTKKAFNIIN